ncbi:hypothetical protein BACCAP_04637 [Pseudoflavonifractor capillosus ATCC 29799]|uniref:CvpA family protein n=1 Tax=Pseudoflavonifractor capillosus ATCC 29799 TaxID=411467 RepID=A6P2A7_9FIRM|nr:hypothetical protein [Pseudoflavonifractor capillosus]EDM97494.1 hypothetical protein BACCAP_04637 [Pseudoflavonifractor capillosus ATCC 29799]
MNQKKPKSGKKLHAPKSKVGKVLLNLVITAIIGFVYFYFTLPALNLQSEDFYAFVGLLCVVYIVCAFITSGFHLEGTTVTTAAGTVTTAQGGKVKEYFRFIKKQCLPIGILLGLLIVVGLVGQVISLPIFRAASYRELLDVQEGDFVTDVQEISFDEIPMLDEDSARYLSTTQMGTIPDMASQFEVAYDSTQINYQGRPVRVAPLEYADLIKWFTNRSEGLPAYIVVDMVTQEVQVVRLPEGQGMKYSPSEPLNRNVYRHLRFNYPTYMFATPSFEIDEEGNPWWICPRVVKTIGLFGGTDISGAVLMNAVTGECTYYAYEDVPQWVDRVYLASLIMQQYDYYGTLIHGFINSIFGQKDVRVTTEGYNYIAMNDDVYMYTGITSATSDQSNLGFLLCNQRTKETKFYEVPGATEQSAQASAEGMVQDQGYKATFPLLLNVADQPTYFIALKDNRQLVKQYAMVNVGQFTVVGIGDTVASCEQNYLEQMATKGIAVDQGSRLETDVSGVIADIRSAVIDGNTYYYFSLEGEDVYYSIPAKDNDVAVILNPGDRVTINHAPVADGDAPDIVEGYTIVLDRRG